MSLGDFLGDQCMRDIFSTENECRLTTLQLLDHGQTRWRTYQLVSYPEHVVYMQLANFFFAGSGKILAAMAAPHEGLSVDLVY
jgi:hypothetical protein